METKYKNNVLPNREYQSIKRNYEKEPDRSLELKSTVRKKYSQESPIN